MSETVRYPDQIIRVSTDRSHFEINQVLVSPSEAKGEAPLTTHKYCRFDWQIFQYKPTNESATASFSVLEVAYLKQKVNLAMQEMMHRQMHGSEIRKIKEMLEKLTGRQQANMPQPIPQAAPQPMPQQADNRTVLTEQSMAFTVGFPFGQFKGRMPGALVLSGEITGDQLENTKQFLIRASNDKPQFAAGNQRTITAITEAQMLLNGQAVYRPTSGGNPQAEPQTAPQADSSCGYFQVYDSGIRSTEHGDNMCKVNMLEINCYPENKSAQFEVVITNCIAPSANGKNNPKMGEKRDVHILKFYLSEAKMCSAIFKMESIASAYTNMTFPERFAIAKKHKEAQDQAWKNRQAAKPQMAVPQQAVYAQPAQYAGQPVGARYAGQPQYAGQPAMQPYTPYQQPYPAQQVYNKQQ